MLDVMALMLWYQNVFSPVNYLLFAAAIVVLFDWWRAYSSLFARFATIFIAWVVGRAIYQCYYVFTPQAPQWVEDAFAVAGLIVGIAIVLIVWKVKRYGKEMIGGIIAAIVVTVPYMLISPFWNISGHVAYTMAPTVYLMGLNRKLAVLLPIPLLMVVNRPIVGAHTWAESIGGLLLGLLALAGVWYLKKGLTYYIK